MKKVIGLFTLLIVIVLGWTAWPYYAVYDFANAIDQGDQVALEHRVDWDSVRRGLRDDLNAFLNAVLGLSKNDLATSPLATGLMALVGPTMINKAIDSYVTPRGMANLIRRGKPSIPNAAQTENSAADQGSASRFDDKQQDRLHWEQVRYAFFSGGPLTFRVDIAPDKTQSGQRPVTLLFKWAGDWKLSRIFVPLDATQNKQADANKAEREVKELKHDPVVRELTPDALRAHQNTQANADKAKHDPVVRPTIPKTWDITDHKSPLNDSPGLVAALQANEGSSLLMLRCKEQKTEVIAVPQRFIQCGNDEIRVVYRLNQGPAIEARWNPSSQCSAAFAPAPIPFIRALSDNGRLFVRLTDRQGTTYDATYDLGSVGEVRARLAAACRWDGTAQKPAPRPSAAATKPVIQN
jgi:hypothetical protein